MKIAWFDCFSGISGDMIIGALLHAGLDFDAFKAELAKLNLDFELSLQQVEKRQIAASKFDMTDANKRLFKKLSEIRETIQNSDIPTAIKQRAHSIFLSLAKAEARVHNKAVADVHFHEIGVLDTLIDVVGALVGLELLEVEKVFASPLNLGSGFVKTAHGKLPVPAPATAELLKGVPTYATECPAELVTPTGAAIISEVAESFGSMPAMTIEQIGYGAGNQDLQHANVLRIFIGESTEQLPQDLVTLIETNIDDMNPQLYEAVFETLMQQGALDVYLTNIQMKKSRPAHKLTVLCEPQDEHKLTQIILRHTTSIGVRFRQEIRRKLAREIKLVETEFGTVRFKLSKLDGEIVTAMPEYEDCKQIAAQRAMPLKRVLARLARIELPDSDDT